MRWGCGWGAPGALFLVHEWARGGRRAQIQLPPGAKWARRCAPEISTFGSFSERVRPGLARPFGEPRAPIPFLAAFLHANSICHRISRTKSRAREHWHARPRAKLISVPPAGAPAGGQVSSDPAPDPRPAPNGCQLATGRASLNWPPTRVALEWRPNYAKELVGNSRETSRRAVAYANCHLFSRAPLYSCPEPRITRAR